MPDKTIKVILTNMPNGTEKPTVLELGRWDERQKQEFLDSIQKHKPDNEYSGSCGFIVHYDSELIAMRPYDTPKKAKPYQAKNQENEFIIEMVPFTESADCEALFKYDCPMCIKKKECTSPFVTKYINETLLEKTRQK